jgi:hypothetical protein
MKQQLSAAEEESSGVLVFKYEMEVINDAAGLVAYVLINF